ncbi:glycoside hydrolase 43 family protein [Actinosynnema sp. NPDC059797]
MPRKLSGTPASTPPPRRRGLRAVATTIALAGATLTATGPAARATGEWAPAPSYTSTDRGDGTYSVPLLNSDVPDVSVERVPAAENDEGRDVYYMISTTMHLSPGAPIMKSYDLVNWEIVNYVFDRADIGDSSSLRNGRNSYGQGQWASSLRHRDGRFYVAFNTNNLGGSYLYTTDDIEDGAWTRLPLGRAFHDPSLYFDERDGGTPYIFYGSGSTSAVKLDAGLTRVVAEYPNVLRPADYPGSPFLGGLFEGAQVQYIDGHYYVVIITWPPGQGRQVVLFRSPHLLGRYATADGSNPYQARGVLNSNGFAQGSLVPISRADGGTDWHGLFFRDSFPVGRIPALIPATWRDGWPTFGHDGVVPVDGAFPKPIRLSPAQEALERQKAVVASDDFANDAPHKAYMDERWTIPAPTPGAGEHPTEEEIRPNGSRLGLTWQWNHAPDNRHWSLTDRDGWLRLTTGKVVTGDYAYTKLSNRAELTWFEEARNTLSQRVFGPKGSAETKLDVSGMRDGDVAGLAMYNRGFSYVAVKRVDGRNTLGVVNRVQPFPVTFDQATAEGFVPGTEVPLGDAAEVHLKGDVEFDAPTGQGWTTFYYSLDGLDWHRLGNRVGPQALDGSLAHFMGHRWGLFNYATAQAGGHVDFDHFLLGDTLTAEGRPLDTGALDAAIAHARTLDEHHYPADAWAAMREALRKAQEARASRFGTQNQIDAPERALSLELVRLGVARVPVAVGVSARTRCTGPKVVLTVEVTNHEAVPVDVTVGTPYGTKSFRDVKPGKTRAHPFATRERGVPAGSALVTASATVDGEPRTAEIRAPYEARTCR